VTLKFSNNTPKYFSNTKLL